MLRGCFAFLLGFAAVRVSTGVTCDLALRGMLVLFGWFGCLLAGVGIW